MTEYAKRDARALEPYYNRHVSAMTHERLDAKSDIAAELAWRDKLIAELTAKAILPSPEGYRLQPEEEYYETQVTLDDLRTLVLRLAHALERPGGNVLLAQRATDYLRRKGLMPSSLRRAEVLNRVVNRSWERFKAELEREADTQLLNWLGAQEGIQVAQRRPPLDDAYYWIVEFPEREREDGERGLNLRGTLAAAMKRWPAPDRVEPKP